MACQRARRNRWRPLAVWLSVGAALAPARALADPVSGVQVLGDPGGCPTPAQVSEALAGVWPELRVDTGPAGEGTVPVQILDLGLSVRVRVGGDERELTDWNRRCEQRARMAAVYVALVLRPAAEAPPVPPAEARVAPMRRVASAPASTASRPATAASRPAGAAGAPAVPPRAPCVADGWRVDAGLSYDAASEAIDGARAASGGAEIGVALEGESLGAVATADALAPTTLRFATAPVRVERMPLALTARALLRGRRLTLAGDLGITVTSLFTEGLAPAIPERAWRLDFGLRAAALVRWRLGQHLQPFCMFRASWSPLPYALAIAPAGTIGRMPALWIGGVAGISWGWQ